MTNISITPSRSRTVGQVTTRQKVGLGIAAVLSLANVVSIFFPTPDGEVGPPIAILAIDLVLGLIGVVAAALAWQGRRVWLRVTAGLAIITLLSSLPAFFVDVSTGVKMLVGVSALLTVAALVLMFSPAPRSTSVLD